MSWIRTDRQLNWAHLFFIRMLKCGNIPKHVAFIMDGNRRYARKNNVEKTQGHLKGFDKLTEALQWCLDMGISEVTVYAFSIENFKRSNEEVEALMDIVRDKFNCLLNERDKLKEKGVKIRIIGNVSLLPKDIIEIISEAELLTKDNNKTQLNVAFSYTAQDEITEGVNVVLNGLNTGSLNEEDLNLNLFSHCLYTHGSIPDLIIRTSGETRLSDFLLFQASCSYLHFTNVLWPELTLWDLLWAIFKYQRVCSSLYKVRSELIMNQVLSQNGKKFLENINKKHFETLSEVLKAKQIAVPV